MAEATIFTLELINDIAEHQENLWADKSEYEYDTYLSEVLLKVNDSLKSFFKKDYLFGKTYYLLSKKPPLTAISFCPETQDNKYFFNGILEAEELVRSGIASSLAEFVVNNTYLGVVISKGSKDIPVIPKVLNYKLGAPINPFEKFDNEKGSKTTCMVRKHFDMANQSGYEELYSYVLRTRNLDKDFNGTIYLVFRRPLELQEYREIIDLFTFIMQARIKYDYRSVVFDHEWRKIAEYKSHALHHQHYAREGIKRNLRDCFIAGDKSGFDYFMQKLDIIDNYTKNLDDMEFALQKVQLKKANYDNLGNTEKIKFLLTPGKIQVRQVFIDCFEMIRDSLELIKFEDNVEHRNLLFSHVIPGAVKEAREQFGMMQLYVIPTMFEVIIQDIIKNAVRFTDKVRPELNVTFDDMDMSLVPNEVLKKMPSGGYIAISIKNNKPVTKQIFDFMLTGRLKEDMPFEKRFSLGVITIHHLLKYDGIGKSGKPWFYTPSVECLSQPFTKTFLLIPKEDIV